MVVECDESWITREMVRARMMHFAAAEAECAVMSLQMWFAMFPALKTTEFQIEWFISYDFTTPHRRRDF